MKIKMQMKGLDQAIRNIENYRDAKLDGVKRVIAETTVNIENEAISRVPVDTGNLKNSIDSQITNEGLTGQVTVGADYGIHVEFGTHKMKAQPYLFPAHEGNRLQYEKAIKDELKKLK